MFLFDRLAARAAEGRPVRVCLIGAGKFGSMFLSQVPTTRGLEVSRIADIRPDGARAAERDFARIREMDALICVSDPVAFGAMMTLRRLGMRMPEDIAVTGFGAFEISQIAVPRITTVDVGADRIGEETGAVIRSVLEAGAQPAAPYVIDIPPRLIEGDST